MDELSKQLIGETRTPIPAAPGQPARCDYEYVRNGVANLFIFFDRREVAAWQEARNRAETPMIWRFTTEDARIRLARLYPSLQP